MIKLLELFAGIGAPRKALEKMGVEYKTIDAVEIDKKAMEAYNLIYGTKHQPRDIVKYHPNLGNEEIDILFQGSPCQDFSLIGKQLGGKKGSQTRSALVWEVIRVVDELKNKPKVIIWENVKSLKSKKHSPVLLEYIEDLKQRGYSSSYKILNAADFGIPQARERVFVVSVLNSAGIEFNFNNVKTKPLEKLTTFLEKEVEKSYYFEKEFFSKKNVDTNQILKWNKKDVCHLPLSTFGQENATHFIGGRYKTLPTLTAKGANSRIKIFVPAHIYIYNVPVWTIGFDRYYLRKITARESWRLMGFEDRDFEKVTKFSRPVLKKLAGNSIVVDVIVAIYKALGIKENIWKL